MDIDKKNRGDPVDCFRECMSAWLKGEDKVREVGGPCWHRGRNEMKVGGAKPPCPLVPTPLHFTAHN